MANYFANYPALEPLASGWDDSPADAVVAGSPLDDQDVTRAEQQYKLRKHRLAVGDVTEAEVLAAKKRKVQVMVENASHHPVGPNPVMNALNDLNTGQQALSNTVQELSNTVQALSNTVQALSNTVNNLSNIVRDESTRNMNRTCVRDNQDPINAMPNAAGLLPGPAAVWFPQHNEALMLARGPNELNPLLAFYGLAGNGNIGEKRRRIRDHLGILL